MAMSKKHYKAIAEIICNHMRTKMISDSDTMVATQAVERVADDLATYFKQDNPRFDEVKFLVACDCWYLT